jgi:hypothetical protein
MKLIIFSSSADYLSVASYVAGNLRTYALWGEGPGISINNMYLPSIEEFLREKGISPKEVFTGSIRDYQAK